jgi:hypothetical protein
MAEDDPVYMGRAFELVERGRGYVDATPAGAGCLPHVPRGRGQDA